LVSPTGGRDESSGSIVMHAASERADRHCFSLADRDALGKILGAEATPRERIRVGARARARDKSAHFVEEPSLRAGANVSIERSFVSPQLANTGASAAG